MPVARYSLVALDCPDPASLADFYAGLLGGEIKQYNEVWYDLYVPGGQRIAFQRAPGHRGPSWPHAEDNSQQLHLDLDVTDMAEAEVQALALGATPLDVEDDGGRRGWRVYADPAGHPFCLCKG